VAVRLWLTVFVSAVFVGACAGELKCPEGTVRDGDTCRTAKDVSPVDGLIFPDTASPDGSPDEDAEDADRPDGQDDVSDDVKDSDTKDVHSTDNFPGGVIGKACNKNSDCTSSTVPNGICMELGGVSYCTLLSCHEEGKACPSGALCMGITLVNPACASACQSDNDCRASDGVVCKLLPDPDGELQSICLGTIKEPRGLGYPCIGNVDCAGSMGCLSNFEAGYCTELRCGPDEPCPEGSQCIRVGGAPVCLKECDKAKGKADNEDCQFTVTESGKGEVTIQRSCVELKTFPDLDRVHVCGLGSSGRAIGEQCLNDTECKSNKCKISFTGTCGDQLTGCLVDRDCPGGLCINASDKTFGYCSQTCSAQVACPAGSLCLEMLQPDGITFKGECMVPCAEGGVCRQEAGLKCHYGDAIMDPGRAACARIPPRTIGSKCADDNDCDVGTCQKASGQYFGVCTKEGCFLPGAKCPFPTTCAKVGSNDAPLYCYVRCLSNADCADGMTCKDSYGTGIKVCVP